VSEPNFYEVVTHNIKMPTGWLRSADGSWTRFDFPTTLPLNTDASTTEAREIIERAVDETPINLQVVVCYRETADRNRLRMLVFKGTSEDLKDYQWDEEPSWFFRAKDQLNRYDKITGDDVVCDTDFDKGH